MITRESEGSASVETGGDGVGLPLSIAFLKEALGFVGLGDGSGIGSVSKADRVECLRRESARV